MPFEFGDVVLVPFPFTNQAASKQRPAIVVSNAAYNRARPDVVVMAVTSQLRPVLPQGEIWISGWKTAGLLIQTSGDSDPSGGLKPTLQPFDIAL